MSIVDLARLGIIKMIKGYQYFLSPFFGQHCRFHPSCSNYAIGAIEHYGILRGGMLALRRLGRCHPMSAGGLDPVPVVSRADREPAIDGSEKEFRC
jgi:putative membrane protein insertion efficiency factor